MECLTSNSAIENSCTGSEFKLLMLNLAGKSVRKVQIYHGGNFFGLKLLDNNLAFILEVVRCKASCMKELFLWENERIVGFIAFKKNYSYSDYLHDF